MMKKVEEEEEEEEGRDGWNTVNKETNKKKQSFAENHHCFFSFFRTFKVD